MKECHQVRAQRTNRVAVASDKAGGVVRSMRWTLRQSLQRPRRRGIGSVASVMALLLATACAALPAPLGNDRIAALLAERLEAFRQRQQTNSATN